MRTFAILVGAALVVGTGHLAIAQNDSTETPKPAGPTRAELQEKQLDATLEARDIERILTKLKRASDLSKERIAAAAKVAEDAASAIDRGDSKLAQKDTKQASEMFREIAKLLEALLEEETPQRIAAARNLADQLSKTERQFAQQFPGVLNPTGSGKNKIDPKSVMKPQKNAQGEGGNQGKAEKPDQKNGGGGKGQKPDGDKPDDPKEGAGQQKDDKEQPNGAGKGQKPEADKPDDPKNGAGQQKDDKEKTNGAGKGQKPEADKPDENGAGTRKEENPADKGDKQNPSGGGGEKQKTDKANEGASGEMTEEERREALAERAEQLAESGKTLQDILKSISQSTDPADKEAVRKIEEILKETNLDKAIESMQQAVNMIRAGKFDDARLASLDIADRMEIAGQRLDAAYRTIVAPQAEDLIELERQLAELREQMEDLKTPSQVRAWHREVDQLLDKLEELGVSKVARDDLIAELKKAGWDPDDVSRVLRGLVLTGGRYDMPTQYTKLLSRIQDELQARIQTLILGDITSATDEVSPPKYQDLVERYLQVLSRDSGKRIDIKNPKPGPKR